MLVPPGFAAVTPYMFADHAERLVAFLVDAVGFEGGSCVGDGRRIDGAEFVIRSGTSGGYRRGSRLPLRPMERGER